MARQVQGFSHNNWEPTGDEYETHYTDDELNGGLQLDHCRLYITNIPSNLTDDGLKTTFSRYGDLIESHLSKNPLKRFALVKYGTSGQAKLAMMKLNNMEPLKLNIAIAKSRYVVTAAPRKMRPNTNGARERGSNKEEHASISSRGTNSRGNEDLNNGDEMEDLTIEDDMDFGESIDPNLHLELENLKLEQLKVKEEQLACKHRMILLKQADRRPLSHNASNNRCILPDGRIVVRNTNDRSQERDGAASFGAGAGDSQKIPGLQNVGSRMCVACGVAADSFCSRCGVTPYCSPQCQRRDWQHRHKAVCHNLARLSGTRDVKGFAEIEPTLPQPAPLRRPRSPVTLSNKRQPPRRDNDFESEKPPANNYPPHNRPKAQAPRANRFSSASCRSNNNCKSQDGRRPPLRHDAKNQDAEDEDWGADKDTPKMEPPQSRDGPTPRQLPRQVPGPAVQKPKPLCKEPESSNKVVVPEVKPPSVVKAPATVLDVTPARKHVPKNYLIEQLSIGDTVLLSVDNLASECRTKRGGFICLSMHEKFEADYNRLCEDYVLDCEADTDPYKLTPGESFSHYNPEDGGWYRARCLTPTIVALLDSSKIATVTATDKCRKLPDQYESVPEFCCCLQAEGMRIGANLKCTLLSKTANGYKVSLEDVESGAAMGEGEVSRWLPDVEYALPAKSTPQLPAIPEVARPRVAHDSRVVLVAAAPERVAVRPARGAATRLYEDVLQDLALYGTKAKPLKEPPRKGQIVVCKLTDGQYYRGLCKRTKVEQNRYLIEYIEYGTLEACPLERLYPCPEELSTSTVPAQVSVVRLSDQKFTFSDYAIDYLQTIKDSAAELILTIPDGSRAAPSGSLVTLTLVKNNEVVNRKVEEMCTPEWKKLQERGGDVIEIEPIKFHDLTYLEIPTDRSDVNLQVLDVSALEVGLVFCCELGVPYAQRVFNQLTDRINEYCNSELCKESYLPQPEELCFAKFPPYPQWFRAVLLEQVSGAGGSQARVYYVDYGNTGLVPVAMLRKMLPEFVRGLPALAANMEIDNFPKEPTMEMLKRAIEHMEITEEGRGVLRATRCRKLEDDGTYVVEAPSLIAAMIGE